mmetsp:Transcript_38190/g.91795  ORF Transcript_38190/g.91795 Transcript_38190/m.91795 type:complete len:82 (+) Transcript_38190:199-444(+)
MVNTVCKTAMSQLETEVQVPVHMPESQPRRGRSWGRGRRPLQLMISWDHCSECGLEEEAGMLVEAKCALCRHGRDSASDSD